MLSNWEAGRSFKPARNASKASGQQGTESMKPRGGALREEPNACCKAFPQFATVSSWVFLGCAKQTLSVFELSLIKRMKQNSAADAALLLEKKLLIRCAASLSFHWGSHRSLQCDYSGSMTQFQSLSMEALSSKPLDRHPKKKSTFKKESSILRVKNPYLRLWNSRKNPHISMFNAKGTRRDPFHRTAGDNGKSCQRFCAVIHRIVLKGILLQDAMPGNDSSVARCTQCGGNEDMRPVLLFTCLWSLFDLQKFVLPQIPRNHQNQSLNFLEFGL